MSGSDDWKAHFCTLLLSGREEDIEPAVALKGENLPERIYRYRAFDSEGYALKGLKEGSVWLAAAKTFNDPFDTTLAADFEPLFHNMLKKVVNERQLSDFPEAAVPGINAGASFKESIDAMMDHAPELTAEQRQIMPQVLLDFLKQQSDERLEALRSTMQNGVKVCSFTVKPHSLAMWAHYTEHHKGFCVEYAVAHLEPLHRRILHPVIYSNQRFDLAPFVSEMRASPLISMVIALHKSLDWSYEEEWRFVIPDGAASKGMTLPMPVPSAVYLGCRAERKNRDKLLQIARKKKIPVFEMRPSTTHYEVEAHPLT